MPVRCRWPEQSRPRPGPFRACPTQGGCRDAKATNLYDWRRAALRRARPRALARLERRGERRSGGCIVDPLRKRRHQAARPRAHLNRRFDRSGNVKVGHSSKNDVSPRLSTRCAAGGDRGPAKQAVASPANRPPAQRAARSGRFRASSRPRTCRARAQLRRDRVPRRRLQLRAARHQRRGRRDAVRPDRQRGLSRSSTRRPAPRCSARSASPRSGPASAASARPTATATRSCSTTSSPTAGSSASSPARRPDRRVRRRLDDERRHRHVQPLRLPPRHQLLRLPAPRRLAGRLLHEHERLQLGGHGVPRPAAVRLRPRGDARRQPGRRSSARARWRHRRSADLPADLDGSTLPPAGAPEPFVEFPGGGDLQIYHFHVDFATPANSTFTHFATPAAGGVHRALPDTRACVPQAGRRPRSTRIGDRLMFRLAYRNFGDHEALVGNYTVSSGGVAGIRWFEIRNATPGRRASSSRAPTSPTPPGAGWAARRWTRGQPRRRLQRLERQHQPADPLRRAAGERPAEHAGPGRGPPVRRHRQPDRHQQPLGRLQRPDRRPGGRLHLLVHQRVLRHDQLVQLAHPHRQLQVPQLHGRAARHADRKVTDSSNSSPIAGAKVDTNFGSTVTDASGNYKLTLPTGTYSVTYSAFGYGTDVKNGVVITDGGTTTKNVALTPSPSVTLSGNVTDGSGHGGRSTLESTSPASRAGRSSPIRSPATTASSCRRTRATT